MPKSKRDKKDGRDERDGRIACRTSRNPANAHIAALEGGRTPAEAEERGIYAASVYVNLNAPVFIECVWLADAEAA